MIPGMHPCPKTGVKREDALTRKIFDLVDPVILPDSFSIMASSRVCCAQNKDVITFGR
jgi:hypothetical protein